MYIVTEIIKKEKVTKEISLPYHTKSSLTYYRINEDQSVLSVFCNYGYSSISVAGKDNCPHLHEQALQADPCSAEEVEEAIKRTLENMDTIVNSVV